MRQYQVLEGDSLTVLRTLPDESVHCCVTSPPYWGLRDYGTAEWEGGDSACEHTGVARRCDKVGRTDKQSTQKGSSSDRVSRTCILCGATRIDKQLGLERTPEEYVAAMVSVFREVRRVLRADGTCWMNLGDSYASNGGDLNKRKPGFSITGHANVVAANGAFPGNRTPPPGLKPKDLVGIPWRVAFALQADGWYLRSDIIWHKPNPMPESVTDRPTKAHEYLFLLTKSERYAYDAAAIAEPHASGEWWVRPVFNIKGNSDRGDGGQPPHSAKEGRNKRSVWSVTSEPYSEAHFAVMPTALVEPCVMAGCPEGGTVLDPFAGSGTVGVVATRHDRDFIGIELNQTYAQMARDRIADDAPLFNVSAAEDPQEGLFA